MEDRPGGGPSVPDVSIESKIARDVIGNDAVSPPRNVFDDDAVMSDRQKGL